MGVVKSDDGRVILRGITWETYECLLKNYENQSAPRLTYDQGVLEIMSPLIPHEENNRLIARIVETILEEWAWEYRNVGSFTCKREDAERGFEPDTAFYIQNVALIGEMIVLDLDQGDPAPDLIVEIDMTSSSLPKQPLFAAFGIPEIWRYLQGNLSFLRLSAGSYTEVPTSVALPGLSSLLLNQWLSNFSPTNRLPWLREIRAWAQENRPDA